MSTLKRFLFLGFLMLMIFPSLQDKMGFFVLKPLKGVFSATPVPAFSDSLWFSGTYQQQYARHIEDSVGFRDILVRLNNQVDFSLFRLANAAKITVGKDGYLFGGQYIESYLGYNFVGKRYCDEKVKQLRLLQDKLWKEKRIFLLVILTPDKGTFYPEKIPSRFLNKPRQISNYAYYARKCAETGINMIDFNEWFRLARDTSRYPLYPKTGIHWSYYGAMRTADSLIRYLENKLDIRLPEMVVDSIEISKNAQAEDNDIGSTMNLICDIPYPAYAYPKVHFVSDSLTKKPSALFIGDSFYWNWYNPGYIKNIFSNQEFWYYDKDVYPETFTTPLSTNQINTKEAVNRQNIIILIQTNGAYGNPGYGFPDRVFNEMDSVKTEILAYERSIRNSPGWMKLMEKKAKERKISLDEMIRIDARYLMEQEQSKSQNKQNR